MRGSKKEKTLCNKPRQRLDFMCLHAYMKKKRTTRSGNTFSFVPVMLFPLFVRACVCECVCVRVCACARVRVRVCLEGAVEVGEGEGVLLG